MRLWFQVASVREEASLAQREDGTFLCAFLRGALAAFSPTFIKTASPRIKAACLRIEGENFVLKAQAKQLVLHVFLFEFRA